MRTEMVCAAPPKPLDASSTPPYSSGVIPHTADEVPHDDRGHENEGD